MRKTMVFLLMALVLAVGLTLPGTALAAPKVRYSATDVQAYIVASPNLVSSGGIVQLDMYVINSRPALYNVKVELPQLGIELSVPLYEHNNGAGTLGVLDCFETWQFPPILVYPTKTTRYVANLQGTDVTGKVYIIKSAASVRVTVTR